VLLFVCRLSSTKIHCVAWDWETMLTLQLVSMSTLSRLAIATQILVDYDEVVSGRKQ